MTALRSWIVALAVVACALTWHVAADLPNAVKPATPHAQLRDRVAERLAIETFTLQQVDATTAGNQLTTTLELQGQRVTLQLTKHSVRSPKFQVLAQLDASGELTPIPAPAVRTYDGTVLEWPGSRVAGSFRNGRLRAIIHAGEQRFAVEPIGDLDVQSKDGEVRHVAYDLADLPAAGFGCGVTEQAQALRGSVEAAPAGERRVNGSGLVVAEVGIDADHIFYLEESSDPDQVIDKIEDTTNGVRLDYEVAAIGMTFEITTIIIRVDVNDPYMSNIAGELLDEFEDAWNTAPENAIPRDCAQLYTGINLQPPPIGIANTFSGCFVGSAYNVIEANSVGSLAARVALSSHEFGHIWGALHCDGCSDCASCCRIMCSGLGGCTGIFSSFGCNSTSAISSFVNGSSCLDDLPPTQELPFCEDWAVPSANSDKWLFVKGATGSGAASNPPSAPFVIELDASGSGEYQDDELRSSFINLQGQSDVEFSYYTQHIGVEAGETLHVEYRSITKQWVPLNTITSDGVDQTEFVFHMHTLPPLANFNEFQMRFFTDVNSTSDNWFIDDISLNCLPPPVCEEPCTDDDACTINDTCVSEFVCAGMPVDCSGLGDACNAVSCDPRGADGNCDVTSPANDGGACDGGSGFCSSGTCASPATTGRIFMAADGQQGSVNSGGPTALLMGAGTLATVGVFIEENSPPGLTLNGYQVLFPTDATPLPGATGTVSYVDNIPGQPVLGDSILVDEGRADWVFAAQPPIPPSYNETIASGFFGVFDTTLPGVGIDVAAMPGIQYLAQFDIAASLDALGDFELRFRVSPDAPPLTTLFNPLGAIYSTDQQQTLIVTVGEVDCITAPDCGDIIADGVRDDPCQWYACAGGVCSSQLRTAGQADMGGANGACPIDGACDGNDNFHALNCFSNMDTLGSIGYPCESSPPAALNIDAGGPSISCTLDGVCDGNDAFHALNCFENLDSFGNTPYPCGCSGPGPAPVVAPSVVIERTGVTLVGPRRARPGQRVDIDIFIDDPLDALRGYQLHLNARGGTSGALELIDMAVEDARRDFALAGAPEAWIAFNRKVHQLLVGMNASEGVSTLGRRYAATVSYHVPEDAAGDFVVDLLHGSDAAFRSFLFGAYARPVVVTDVTPARIRVVGEGR